MRRRPPRRLIRPPAPSVEDPTLAMLTDIRNTLVSIEMALFAIRDHLEALLARGAAP